METLITSQIGDVELVASSPRTASVLPAGSPPRDPLRLGDECVELNKLVRSLADQRHAGLPLDCVGVVW